MPWFNYILQEDKQEAEHPDQAETTAWTLKRKAWNTTRL